MKIVKCSRCGKTLIKSNKCYHCGNLREFDFIRSVNPTGNAADKLLRLEQLVSEKKYEDALAISFEVIEWLPDESSVYWFRLLARNQCSDASELIAHGFDYINDADIHNAVRYAPANEKQIYSDIQDAVRKLQGALLEAISVHRINSISATGIVQAKKDAAREIESRRKRITALWNELEDIEAQMYLLETDCKLVAREHQASLSSTAKAADSTKNEIYRLSECTEENRRKYIAYLTAYEKESNESKFALINLRSDYESARKFNALAADRDRKSSEVSDEISNLRKYEQNLRRKIAEVEKIETRHNAAVQATENFNFSDAAALLGMQSFSTVLNQSGTWMPSTSVVAPERTTQRKQQEPPTTSGGTDDDYFAAWSSKKK